MLLVTVVFAFTVVVAAVTLDHAVRDAGYLTTYSNGDYFSSGPPSLRDALLGVFLGPGDPSDGVRHPRDVGF